MTRISDTSPEAERVLLSVYRRMPMGDKWRHLGEMYQDARFLHAAGVRLRNPTATQEQIHQAWLQINLGFKETVGRAPTPLRPMQNLVDIREVIRILNNLAIPYALGGSMASSLHGIERYTRDGDLTVEPFPGREDDFAAAFGPDWYVSVSAARDANQRRAYFNVINTATGFKVDLFVRKDQPFEREAMARRVSFTPPEQPDQPIFVHSAEDVILFKLRWYRLGGEVIDQQWTDVLNVMKVQIAKLDRIYLDHWASDLGVSDLLARARQEAGF
jgi:hypothetical protein